jgi:membrane-bound metal-dependent hydrolase YbcI (DUF457 family)
MPSPVGHALGGAIVALLAADSHPARPQHIARPRHQLLMIASVAACLPDIDFLWGRHNMETHSVGFAALVAFTVLAWRRSRREALAAGAAVLTHVLFDWLGSDDAAPLGVMALWPFSDNFYFANAFLFEPISRQYWQPWFMSHNLLAIARELLMLGGPMIGLAWWRRRSGRRTRSE